MSNRPVQLLTEDIYDAVGRIENYTRGMSFDTFAGDEKSVDAVVRNLEIIGEAANRLPEEFREKHSAIEWYKIIGLRHRIVHEYFGVDVGIIWQVVQHDLPIFKSALHGVRKQLGL